MVLHQTTLRLAGKATHKIAQQTNAKSDYRITASLLRDSVNMNPKDKKSSRAYNDLLNEMQEKRIRRRSFRKLLRITAIATLLLIVGTLVLHLNPPLVKPQCRLLRSHRAPYFLALSLSEAIHFLFYFQQKQR